MVRRAAFSGRGSFPTIPNGCQFNNKNNNKRETVCITQASRVALYYNISSEKHQAIHTPSTSYHHTSCRQFHFVDGPRHPPHLLYTLLLPIFISCVRQMERYTQPVVVACHSSDCFRRFRSRVSTQCECQAIQPLEVFYISESRIVALHLKGVEERNVLFYLFVFVC